MTMTQPANDVQVVPMTMTVAEVRLHIGGTPVSIGKVATANGRWYWQHRDGEQSSPVSATRTEAASALAGYHRAFKQPAAPPAAPTRRLLFG
jgi:hypothetical protein